MIYFTSLTVYLFWASGCLCELDTSAPDLSRFKLRPVNAAELAHQRAKSNIHSLAVGAKHMHESLYTDELFVVCPAYEHLFRLIENQNMILMARGIFKPKPIRQDVVQMLAVVVTSDRILYNQLFSKSVKRSEASRHFLKAAHDLEHDNSAQDTWWELVQCLASYMKQEELVTKYLEEPRRADYLSRLISFKEVSIDDESAVSSEKAPHGLVERLARRFEAGRPRLAHDLDGLEAHIQQEAQALIESLDDEETAQERRQLISQTADSVAPQPDPEAEPDSNASVVAPEVIGEPTSGAEAEAEPAGRETSEADSIEPADQSGEANGSGSSEVQVEVVVPVDVESGPSDIKSRSSKKQCDVSQLSVMEFVKFRLLGARAKQRPVPMQLAFDFYVHWWQLHDADLDTSDRVGNTCAKFVSAPDSAEVAARVKEAIATYLRIAYLLNEMEQKQERSRRSIRGLEQLKGFGEGWSSLAELELFYLELTTTIDRMEPLFDIDDFRRLEKLWKRRYDEYNTLDRFISSSSW